MLRIRTCRLCIAFASPPQPDDGYGGDADRMLLSTYDMLEQLIGELKLSEIFFRKGLSAMCDIGGEKNKHQNPSAKSSLRYLTASDYSQLSRLQVLQ